MLNKWDNAKIDKEIFIKGLDIDKIGKFVNKIYVK